MSELIVLLEGLGSDFLLEAARGGKAPNIASILGESKPAEFFSPEDLCARATLISGLTGAWGTSHGMLCAVELDGKGGLRATPGERRGCFTVPEIADMRGRKCLGVNIPACGARTEGTIFVTDDFFSSSGSVFPAEVREELLPLIVPAGAITDAHLATLGGRLGEFAADDRRRRSAAGLLARALSIHNVATALGDSDEFDLVVVRYDTVDLFFSVLIDHWPKPAAYVPAVDAQRVAGVMPAVIQLHDQFLGRLRELTSPSTTVICSFHGYWAEPRRPAPAADVNNPQVPVHLSEYLRPVGWVACSDPAVLAGPVRSIVDVGKVFGRVAGIPVGELPMTREGEKYPGEWLESERELDDEIELGLVSLGDMGDSSREQTIVETLRTQAVHAIGAGDFSRAIESFDALLGRSFDFADAIRLLQLLIQIQRFDLAGNLAEMAARLAPQSVMAQLAEAHVLLKSGRRAAGIVALERAAGIDAGDARVKRLVEEFGVENLVPRKPGPFVGVDNCAGARLVLEKADDWWGWFSEEMRDVTAEAEEAHARLREEVGRLDGEARLRTVGEAEGEENDPRRRFRAGGLSSVSRHFDPREASGLKDALVEILDPGFEIPGETFAERAKFMHGRIFAGTPKHAGVYRSREGLGFPAWLDGTYGPVTKFTAPEFIQRDMNRLGVVLAARRSSHSLLVAGALLLDYCSIHPFVDGNGRSGRTMALRYLLEHGFDCVRWINFERRLDRSRAVYSASFSISRTSESDEIIRFFCRAIRDGFVDAERRVERLGRVNRA